MASFVLKVRNLTKIYGERKAVDNISFEVFQGEIFGFLGPNGAGKTTTLKIITGLAKPTSGLVEVCGYNVVRKFEKAVNNIGGIIENPELYSYMSGIDNLKYYASLYNGITRAKIKEVIELVGMQSRIKDKVKTYSLGMRQRVGIAQALLHSPRLLVLDEPTNGLDPEGIQEMRGFLKKLAHEQKISIIISSHILSEMEQLCDTIAIIDNGKIIEVKSLQEIKQTAEKSQKISIRVDYPNYAGKIIMSKLNVEVQIAGNSIIFPLQDENIPKATSALIAKGISIYGVTTLTKSLEEVFMEIIEKHRNRSASVAIF
ncbi:MAG: ABC transporter ATP-binding protein [Clostridia bacterium]|nr:ABC transporter ATP-binding protein [Clostridia bacterium]